ncbi:MFS transporter [Dermatophilus congolensis]|nr:MFS transporter [Dermatophilus congolensis]
MRDRAALPLLAASEILGAFATQIAAFAIPLFAVISLNVDSFHIGVLNSIESAAAVAAGLLVGARVDIYGGRFSILVAHGLRCAALVFLAVACVIEPAFWMLLVAMFLLGVGAIVNESGVDATLVELGGRDVRYLNKANSLLRAGSVLSEIGGPGVAGVLVAGVGFAYALGGGGVFFALAFLFALIATSVPRFSRKNVSSNVKEREGSRRGIFDGITSIMGNPLLRPLVISTVQSTLSVPASRQFSLFFA